MRRERTALENVRRARTLNQEQVASVLGITRAHYSKIERGRIAATPAIRMRLSALLGAPANELFPVAVHP